MKIILNNNYFSVYILPDIYEWTISQTLVNLTKTAKFWAKNWLFIIKNTKILQNHINFVRFFVEKFFYKLDLIFYKFY